MKLFKKHTIYFRIVVYKAAASSAMYSGTYQLNQIAVTIYYHFQYRNVQNYIKRLESFSDAYITYRILLTIHVIVASVERTFFKIKNNKILFEIDYVTRKIKWISHIINRKINVNGT